MTHGQVLAADDRTPGAAARLAPVSRDRIVGAYVVLAMLALLPGLARRFGISAEVMGPMATHLSAVWHALDDIRFGSGLRFWVGVAGAAAMALTLLYPLRKMFARLRLPGSVGAWFHIHLLLGLGGPVLVLYHADFGHGGSNANIALWSMIVVVVGGFAGHFVYRRASAEFYGERVLARQHLDAIAAALRSLETGLDRRDQVLAALEQIEARLLATRPGLMPAVRARIGLRRLHREVLAETRALLDAWAHASRIDMHAAGRVRHEAAAAIETYVRLARRTASRSLAEQLAAQWRLLHVPVFLVMCVAIALHVVAVWDMDGALQGLAATSTPGTASARPPAPIQQLRRQTIAIDAPAAMPNAEAPALSAPPKPAQRVEVAPRPPTVQPSATPPPASPPRTQSTQPAPAPPPFPRPPTAAPLPVEDVPRPRAGMADVYAELQKRTGTETMKLGGAEPRTLTEQLATLKARFKAKTFLHSLEETGFALTGKHVAVDCASCHQKPLREARSDTPRTCVACHRKDDVHRGRRPDCARCHTTNRWSEIVRR